MAYEVRNGTFSLFKNDKGDNEARPDYTGTGKDLDGNEIKIAAWIKEPAAGGRKFMSCTMQLKEQQPVTNPSASDDDDGEPF